MSRWLLVLLFACGPGAWGQNSSAPAASAPAKPSTQNSQSNDKPSPPPDLIPPNSDTINVRALDNEAGESSSKSTEIDLSPPPGDARAHPGNSDAAAATAGSSDADVNEMHPWNPHKAAKDIEVGDFYFKRKNYKAAEDRYREALFYKSNDAITTYRLAVCLEKMDEPDEAIQQYENYLKILPYGPEAEHARKAMDRLKNPTASAKSAK
ncbi:MAG TPA: hypothetical protein VMG31_09135 [Verrucomicrobiae bacterium]|nr:hypothetical protein [Verrucomicrobiae bacterium]